MADTTTLTVEQGPSVTAVPSPTVTTEALAAMVKTQASAQTAAQAVAAATQDAAYEVLVKAPAANSMLAYLIGPGAHVVLQGVDLSTATVAQEGGNLRISLPNGGEVLLLDFVASARDANTVVVTDSGTLPAQKLLASLDAVQTAEATDLANVEPAAGPTASGNGGAGSEGGFAPPTILGTGVGEGVGIYSSVIDPFALPIARDEILIRDYPFEPGTEGPLPTPPQGPAQLPPVARNDTFSTAIDTPLTLAPAKLLANDSDPEGDPISIVSVQGPAHGTVSIVNGQVVFTPEPGFTGNASFSYTITDGKGGTSTADVTIQVDPTFPGQNTTLAADDATSVIAGSTKVINVLTNDSDPQGDALVPGSVRIITPPSVGKATVNPDGTISFDSTGVNPGFVTFVYEVSDARGAKDTATVTVEVLSSANDVTAVDDTGEIIPAGAAKIFNVVANDLDAQGDTFQVTRIVSGPEQGSATFNPANGTITYQSVTATTGYDVHIVYEITDARGAKDTATLTVRVEPTNNVSAVDDTADLLAGQDVKIDVLKNDFDQQSDSFHVTRIVEQPHVVNGAARGSVVINSDGTITYTDTAGARDSAVVEFKYEIVDSKGATDIAVVRVTIGTAPNGVDANDDTLTLAQDAPKTDITATLLSNDFDAQKDPFTITAVGTVPASKGVVSLEGGKVFFTPAAGFHGPVDFTYTITDSKGATDTAVVTLTVQEPLNTTLNAGDDVFSTPFNTNLTITPAQLLANDNDPQGTVLGAANITAFTQPAHGVVTQDANGNLIYNPTDDFKGTDTFTYTIKDAQGDVDTATVTIRVADPLPQDHPVDAVDDTVTVRSGDTTTINVLTNDNAPDGGLTFVSVVGPLPAGVTDLGGGRFSYTAPTGAGGTDVTFQYKVKDIDGDEDTATVTIHVSPNSVDAVDDTVTLTRDGSDKAVDSVIVAVKANDTDPQSDTFSVTRVVAQPAIGSAVLNADGTITYTADPAHREAYDATFTYEIVDSKGAKDVATVTVHVGADFNSVDAVDDVATLVRDGSDKAVDSVVVTVKANDTDPQSDTFSVTRVVAQPSIGTATLNADGTITYTADPAHREAYDATFTYEIVDSKGAKDVATVTVHVGADFNSVDAVDDVATLVRNGSDKAVDSVIVAVKANDTDPQGDTFSVTRVVAQPTIGSATLNADGTITYTADPAHREAYDATFTYEIVDSKGAKDVATVTVHVGADFNSVDAVDDVATLVRNGSDKAVDSVIVAVKANDTDPQGDTFSVTRVVAQPSIGTATLNADGTITYTADPAHREAYDATFTYEIVDSKGAKDVATVTVHVGADFNSVDAVDDVATLVRDGSDKAVDSVVVTVKANDTDPQSDTFSVTRVVAQPSIGTATLNADGTITYTADPAHREAYDATFTYEIVDSKGAKDVATVTVHVGADFNSVDAVNDTATAVAGHPQVISVLGNDVDPQGDTFSITGFTQPAHGTVVKNADGTFTYTADPAYNGPDIFTYTVTDSKGATDTATVSVNVTPNSVDAVDDVTTLVRNGSDKAVDSVIVAVKANDTDPQGDTFSVTRVVAQPSIGSATLNADGTITYTADPAHREAYDATFTYEIVDSKGAKDVATVTVHVGADFNSVVAHDDTASMAKDISSILVDAKANDSDPQGDTFSITKIVSVDRGAATIENGQIRYTDTGRDAGTAHIVYEITDSKGATSQATVTVNIAADSNTVVAVNDNATVVGGNAVIVNVKANDYDPQGDSFTVTRIVRGPDIGSATLNADGTITYESRNMPYTTSIVYEITDSKGATSQATLSIDTIMNFSNSRVPGSGGNGGSGKCPLTIDLNGDGISISMLANSTAVFDLDGNGYAERTSWISGNDDALLAIDRNGNGTIDGVNEVFGGTNLDGFTDLRAEEDSNQDGLINSQDANFAQLKLWLDANHDGVTQAGELHNLSEFGVNGINLNAQDVSIQYGDAYISNQGDVSFADGSVRHIASSVFYTNGGDGVIHGTTGDDVMVYTKDVKALDGGLGHDTLTAYVASDITLTAENTKGVEVVDLHNGLAADTLNLNIGDVLAMTDNGILTIQGDAVDHVNLAGDAVRGDNVVQEGVTYASFSSGNATVLVELGMTVNNEHLV